MTDQIQYQNLKCTEQVCFFFFCNYDCDIMLLQSISGNMFKFYVSSSSRASRASHSSIIFFSIRKARLSTRRGVGWSRQGGGEGSCRMPVGVATTVVSPPLPVGTTRQTERLCHICIIITTATESHCGKQSMLF